MVPSAHGRTALLLLLLVAAARTSEAVEYTITDLGALSQEPNRPSCALDINDAGQIVGTASLDDGTNSLFLWDRQNGIQDLGIRMPPDPVAPYSINYASINNAGQIAGSTYDIGGFLWTSSTDIRQLLAPDGMHGASVYGVNDVGVTVGQAPLEGTHQYPACVWDAEGNGQYLDIFSGWHSEALDVNNAGQVVGWSENYSAETGNRAFLWDETNGMQNLGTLEGGGGSSARAINNLGQVVGDVGFPLNETRAFIWDAENGMRPLESPEGLLSEACDINDAGQIVGRAGRNGFAALWENGEILNIDVEVGHPAGWGGIRILAINNSGQMVGWGENPEDQYRALLLTPVPEPAAGAMLLAGALALAALGRLRARGPG